MNWLPKSSLVAALVITFVAIPLYKTIIQLFYMKKWRQVSHKVLLITLFSNTNFIYFNFNITSLSFHNLKNKHNFYLQLCSVASEVCVVV